MTNAEAIRNLTDEELATVLGTIVVKTTRQCAKSAIERLLTNFGLVEKISLANAAIDAHHVAEGHLADELLKWLKSPVSF